jgi:hypothetical protein
MCVCEPTAQKPCRRYQFNLMGISKLYLDHLDPTRALEVVREARHLAESVDKKERLCSDVMSRFREIYSYMGQKNQSLGFQPRKLEVSMSVRNIRTESVIFEHSVSKHSSARALDHYQRSAAEGCANQLKKKILVGIIDLRLGKGT